MKELTDQEKAAIQSLRAKGYAVSYWNPEELGNVQPFEMEERLGYYGDQVIEDWNKEEEE